ncbi:signal peptidase I [Bifidobacterium sp.]|jgi:signal peptidase I|uniref:signal peptidase I n=2 Tax=Bifidobacterium sp. TaxID=41200 RepID=UPI003DA813DC
MVKSGGSEEYMQRSDAMPEDGDLQDSHILEVADQGVDPVPVARTYRHSPAHSAPAESGEGGVGWRDTLIWCGIPVLIVMLVRIFLLGFYTIPTQSMMDTIIPGDRVITTKLTPRIFALHRGDVVVFKDPAHWLQDENNQFLGDDLIKRLIGLPGDVVACEGAGKPVTINGVAINESSYIRPGVEPSAFAFRVHVSADHVFVMGDNRSSSADSRFHRDDGANGLVPISDITGVALVTYWPFDRIGTMSGHHDIFAEVPAGTMQSSARSSAPSGQRQ